MWLGVSRPTETWYENPQTTSCDTKRLLPCRGSGASLRRTRRVSMPFNRAAWESAGFPGLLFGVRRSRGPWRRRWRCQRRESKHETRENKVGSGGCPGLSSHVNKPIHHWLALSRRHHVLLKRNFSFILLIHRPRSWV